MHRRHSELAGITPPDYVLVLALAYRILSANSGLDKPPFLLPAAPLPRHLHPHVQGRSLHHASVPFDHGCVHYCVWPGLPSALHAQQCKSGRGIHFCLQGVFITPGWSLLKTFVMMIGEFEYEELFFGEISAPYEYYSVALFMAFVLVMSIVTMNLLVGLAVDNIQEIQENAELIQLSMNVSAGEVAKIMLSSGGACS